MKKTTRKTNGTAAITPALRRTFEKLPAESQALVAQYVATVHEARRGEVLEPDPLMTEAQRDSSAGRQWRSVDAYQRRNPDHREKRAEEAERLLNSAVDLVACARIAATALDYDVAPVEAEIGITAVRAALDQACRLFEERGDLI
jgi:hypothetical protein